MLEQLNELLEMQYALDEAILKEHGNVYDEKIAEQMKIALFVELGEMMNELPTKFKCWKKTAKDNKEKALVEYEVLWDNYLLNIFKEDRADVFSVAPIAGFYTAKKIEIKMVRMILTCLKNRADLKDIKARLRGFYA